MRQESGPKRERHATGGDDSDGVGEEDEPNTPRDLRSGEAPRGPESVPDGAAREGGKAQRMAEGIAQRGRESDAPQRQPAPNVPQRERVVAHQNREVERGEQERGGDTPPRDCRSTPRDVVVVIRAQLAV